MAAASRRPRDFNPPSSGTNPLYQPTRGRLGGWFAALACLALIGGGVYLATARQFRIATVEVVGTQKLDRRSIADYLQHQLDRTTFGVAWSRISFIVPLPALARELRSQIESVASLSQLSLERRGNTGLRVVVTERVPAIVWVTERGENFSLDDNGIIVERLRDDPPDDLPQLTDANGLVVKPGVQVVRPALLAGLHTFDRELPGIGVIPSTYSTWPVQCLAEVQTAPPPANVNANENENVSIELDTNEPVEPNPPPTTCDLGRLAVDEPTLAVSTADGWELRLDTSGNLAQQLLKLDTALRERLNGQRQTLHYIDVRFGDRVFYR